MLLFWWRSGKQLRKAPVLSLSALVTTTMIWTSMTRMISTANPNPPLSPLSHSFLYSFYLPNREYINQGVNGKYVWVELFFKFMAWAWNLLVKIELSLFNGETGRICELRPPPEWGRRGWDGETVLRTGLMVMTTSILIIKEIEIFFSKPNLQIPHIYLKWYSWWKGLGGCCCRFLRCFHRDELPILTRTNTLTHHSFLDFHFHRPCAVPLQL